MTENALTEWARLFFGSLQRAGVRDVIVSPGSRSTPFTWAALHTPGLECHSAWDERSAAFFALGQVRVSGLPSVLLCTSGSAAAQYFPAVVEAAQSFLPLVIVTADRPFELSDVGAPQAMDQLKLYGSFSRSYVELGNPEVSVGALDALERRVTQAVLTARGPVPGPVHINARAKMPLEPREPHTPEELALTRWVDARLESPRIEAYLPEREPDPNGIRALLDTCRAAPRGLLVAGPLPAIRASRVSAYFELARATGYPLCAETTSQARTLGPDTPADVALVGGFDALLRADTGHTLDPDLVLVLGAPPTSSAFQRFLARSSAALAVVNDHGWLDPSNRARILVQGEPTTVARSLSAALSQAGRNGDDPARRRFAERWQVAEREHWAAVDRINQRHAARLTESVAVRLALEALPSGGLLGLGNSLPIRDADAFVAPGQGPYRVWSQRGVNGIDGLISAGAGAAKTAKVPSLVLIGDVSFFHDLGGLACVRGLDAPLVLTVIDNGGGRIFGELPVAERLASRAEIERYWLTPPGLDLRHAATLFDIAYARADDAASLERALRTAFETAGCTLIHAVVEPNSAREARDSIQMELAHSLFPSFF